MRPSFVVKKSWRRSVSDNKVHLYLSTKPLRLFAQALQDLFELTPCEAYQIPLTLFCSYPDLAIAGVSCSDLPIDAIHTTDQGDFTNSST